MFSHETQTIDDSPSNLNFRDMLGALVLGAVLASVLHTVMQRSPRASHFVNTHKIEFISRLCEQLDLDNCEHSSEHEKRVFVNKLSKAQNLNEAIGLVRWDGGSEREALRYIALIRAIQSERWPNRVPQDEWEVSRDSLLLSWTFYPKLTVASQCYWCSFHDSNMYEWFTNSRLHDDYLRTLIEYTPHLFGQFESLVINDDVKHAMAVRQSTLANHGNRYGFLGKLLFKRQDWDALRILVANTNSAAPIMDLDWSKLPSDIVRLSWQQGVRAGDDLPSFTERMLVAGYRPALRWALWVVAEGQSNPDLRRMQRYTSAYKTMLKKNTEFSLNEGETFVNFYSKNWRQIEFNAASKKWQYRGQ